MGSWGCPYLRRFPFSCAHRTPTASSLFLNCFALRPAGCGRGETTAVAFEEAWLRCPTRIRLLRQNRAGFSSFATL